VISCQSGSAVNNDPDVCTSTLDAGFPTLITGTAPVVFTWEMTGATSAFGTGPIGYYTFNGGVTTITWTATNAAGMGVCTQTVTITDNQPPDFSVPSDKNYCVRNIETANYDAPTIDITPARPDYYLFAAGTTDLDLDPTTFSDNCPCVFAIRWRIDFEDGSFLPALPGTYISGQPSTFGSDILFPGDVFLSLPHHITYQIVDCSGNVSASKTVRVTINPRPDVIKLTAK
jgi:hypothetical protein